MGVRQAVLLLGGRGTRLWPLTADWPKGLVLLAGLPFVEYQLRLLEESGVEHVLLAVGLEHRAQWEAFTERRGGSLRLEVVVEAEPLDTGGQVAAIAEDLDDRFLVLNGDVLFDTPLDHLIAGAPDAPAVLTLATVEDPSAFGVVVVDRAGMVERFVEKPAPGTAPSNAVSAGIYLLERKALEGFGPGPVSFERRVWPHLVERGALGAVVTEGLWLDIGTPSLYLAAHRLVLHGECRLHRPDDPHGTGSGAVVAGRRSGFWSWVGEEAVLEEGAAVDEAVILDGARVHRGAKVEDAVVGWDADLHPGAVVRGQAVVGRGAEVGPDCELDRGVRIAPGTRLGHRSVSFSPPP